MCTSCVAKSNPLREHGNMMMQSFNSLFYVWHFLCSSRGLPALCFAFGIDVCSFRLSSAEGWLDLLGSLGLRTGREDAVARHSYLMLVSASPARKRDLTHADVTCKIYRTYDTLLPIFAPKVVARERERENVERGCCFRRRGGFGPDSQRPDSFPRSLFGESDLRGCHGARRGGQRKPAGAVPGKEAPLLFRMFLIRKQIRCTLV